MSAEIESGDAVVDANVWVSGFITEDVHHLRSRPWLDRFLRTNHVIIGLSLALVEIAGAIVRRTDDYVAARRTIDELQRLPTVRFHTLDDVLITHATSLAIDLRLRGADAVYVALAARLTLPLITWDQELLDRATRVIAVRTPPIP